MDGEESKIVNSKYCTKHSDKAFEFYCQECKEFFCSICIKPHYTESHAVTGLKNLGSALKIALQNQCKKIEGKDTEIKKESEKIETLQANIKQQLGSTKASINTLKKTIEQIEQKIEENYQIVKSELSKKTEEITKFTSEITKNIEEIETLTTEKELHKLFKLKNTAKAKEPDLPVITSLKSKEALSKALEESTISLDESSKSTESMIKSLKDSLAELEDYAEEDVTVVKPDILPIISNYCHMFDEKYNEELDSFTPSLSIFNITNEEQIQIALKDNLDLHMFSDSVQINDAIFVSGGGDKDGNTFKNTYQVLYDLQKLNGHIVKLADMNVDKGCHTLVALNSTQIYSIGGACVKSPQDPVQPMKTVEKYDVVKDVWTMAPELAKEVGGTSACEFRSKFIYTFGGVSKHSGNDFRSIMEGYHMNAKFAFSQLIQKFDTTHQKKGWSIVNLEKQEGWSKRAAAASVQITKDEILIFGGSHDTMSGCNDSFIFNPKTNSMLECETSHPSQAPFFTRKVMISKLNVVFVISYASGELFTFDIEQKQWNEAGKEIYSEF
jgi:hypothetical protein